MSRVPHRRVGGPWRNKGAARTARIGGMEISYDDGLDEHLKSRTQPAPTYPLYDPGKPTPLSRAEETEVAHFLRIRDRFRDGPFFAVIDTSNAAPMFNPFEEMGAYSQKYIKRARTLPLLNGNTRAPRHFPKELLSVVSSSRAPTNATPKMRRPLPSQKQGRETGMELMDDDEEAGEDNAEDGNAEGEVLDDEYESDEDEMAGDYNAEQYFDAGDEVGEDWDGEGGDGEGANQ